MEVPETDKNVSYYPSIRSSGEEGGGGGQKQNIINTSFSGATTTTTTSTKDDKTNETLEKCPSALLIFMPGFFVSPDRYEGLLKRIIHNAYHHHAEDIDVHAATVSFENNFPTKEQAHILVAAALDKAEREARKNLKKGKDDNATEFHFDSVYIVGHSSGGIFAIEEGLPSKYDGIIILGAVFNSLSTLPQFKARSLASYPKPVLTVVGQLDGFIRYLILANESICIEKEIQRHGGAENKAINDYYNLQKPVISLPGINHMQAADDIVMEETRKTGRSDFDSTLSIEQAWDTLANLIIHFLSVHLDHDPNGDHKKEILQLTDQTRKTLQPFRILSSDESISQFAVEMQMFIANISTDESFQVRPHMHESKEDFLFSKPGVSPTENAVIIHYVAMDPIKFHPKSPYAQLSPTYAIKAKSQEHLISAMGGEVVTPKGEQLSLCDLNKRTFEMVMKEYLTEEERERYQKEGRELCFLPDKFIAVPPEWVETPIELTHSDDGATSYIRSPYTTTPVEQYPSKFAGMFYGKPLTKAQAYEWLVYDAFKKVPTTNS